MRVEIAVPSSVELEVDGGTPHPMKATPLFYGFGKEATCLTLKSFDKDGKLLNLSVLKISGKNGKFFVADRTKPVQPALERKPSARKTSEDPQKKV